MMRRAMLRQAAVFHAVASNGSIAAAAAKLGKSAPAVHHDLKCLEDELGRLLFDRVGRALRLTPAARRLFEAMARSLDEIGRELDRFSRAQQPDEVLRVAAVSGFGRYRLARLLFARAGARQVELITGSHDQVLEALTTGRADAAITYKPVAAVPIVVRVLTDEDYVLIGAKAFGFDASPAAIEALGFVTYEEYEYVFARWFEGALGRQPRRLHRSDHVTELEEALESVAAGRGVTITPGDAWRSGPWRRRCRNLLPDGPSIGNRLYVLALADAAPIAADIILDMFAD